MDSPPYKVTAMGKKGIMTDMETHINEISTAHSTGGPDSDSDADVALPCVSDTEDEHMYDTTYRLDTMEQAIPGWTQWQTHIEGHDTQRKHIAATAIRHAASTEALEDPTLPELIDSDQEHETTADTDSRQADRQHWKRMRKEVSMMDKRGRLTVQRHRRKNERRRLYPFLRPCRTSSR